MSEQSAEELVGRVPGVGDGSKRRPPGMGYMPGLDGLRAVSVLAVIVYHTQTGWLSGGFLGVEVFFVVSGYLITSLLFEERQRLGANSMRSFWIRRARRLLPALYALLATCVFIAAVIAPDGFQQLKGDVVAALFYVSNWWQIFREQSYFAAAGRPPLLLHLWSLAVEEQFYLLFPLAFLALVKVRRQRFALAAVIGAIGSAVWMAVLYDPDVDPSRVYMGTDTRLSGLLAGVALAAIWPAGGFSKERAARRAGVGLDTSALLAGVVLIWAFVRVNEFTPFVYRGGFVLIDVATVLLIAAIVHPSARVGRVLGTPKLAAIGRRSYSLYLWHWPVFVVTRPDLDLPIRGLPLFVLRMALTVSLSELSYRLVETPVRQGALRNFVAALRGGSDEADRARARNLLGCASIGLALCVVCLAFGPLRAAPKDLEELANSRTEVIDPTPPATTPSSAAPSVAPTSAPAGTAAPTSATPTTGGVPVTAAPAPTAPPPTVPSPIPGGVTALGDSVMVGAADELKAASPGTNVDAKIGRQCPQALTELRWMSSVGRVQGTLVIHLGTNGWCKPREIDGFMKVAGGRRVLFLNAKAARPWESLANQQVADGVRRWPNAKLADWHNFSGGHPNWFITDGVHLTKAGQVAYAQFVLANLK